MNSESPPCPAPERRAYGVFDPRSAVGRVVIATLAGLGTGFVFSARFGWALSITLGWDAGALLLIGLLWLFVMTGQPQVTRCRAASADPGRTAVWLLVSAASAFSLFSGVGVMRHAKALAGDSEAVLVIAALLAVASAWALTHTAFTLRYAHLYYRDDGEGEGGLVFPGASHPDDFDFAYFAFTIGMCFQVSDVSITSSLIRRAALGHAMLSFAYNTVILALALNLVFGLFG